MSPRSKKLSERMRMKTRKAILDASLELFAKHGFSGTSTAQIARKAGISKGLIFTQFRQKRDILYTIFEEQMDRVVPKILMDDDRRPPDQKLASLATTWVGMLRTDPLLIRLALQLNVDEEYRRLVRSKRSKKYMETLLSQVRPLFRSLGSENPDLDIFLFTFVFDGIFANYAVAAEMLPPLDAITNRLVQLLTRGWRSTRTTRPRHDRRTLRKGTEA